MDLNRSPNSSFSLSGWNKLSKAKKIFVVAILLILAVWISMTMIGNIKGLIFYTGQEEQQPAPQQPQEINIGQEGFLKFPELASSKENLDKFTKALNAHDTNEIKQMILAGEVLSADTGARVLVIGSSLSARQIRILEGENTGNSGWVFTEFISLTKLKTFIPSDSDLYIQAQEFVRQGLKAPATAKFPISASQVSNLGSGQYKIISYVDSQNSYGALLRNDWIVTMKLSENEWILERMVIGGEVIYDPIETERKNKEAEAAREELNREIKKLQKQILDSI